jgi:D-alanyl-D-alanine carboxypeptidase/D-alanyl-D-alanine-endopeptidase (penicillin-binding protein 4)
VPTTAGLARALGPVLSSAQLGGRVGVAVRDLATGRVLYGEDAAGAYVPASTTKILTSTAVLAALGPDHRFSTTVVAGADPHEIVLVGGGDPLLATSDTARAARGDGNPPRQTVDALAAHTARALRASGETQVRVGFDDTLFSEPVSPRWESQYVPTGVVSPISALWVDEGRLDWPSSSPRAKDPALTAAEAFTTALEREGITVSGPPRRTTAPTGADTIARVSSAPLAEIVRYVLETSDNDGAEVLARHVAVAEGRPATFEGATAAVAAVLGRLGVRGEIELYDGSGLSRANRLSADVLTQTLVLAGRPEFPELRAVLTGLPIAGYTGTLDDRFDGDDAGQAVGVVRAKTGTLSGVSSLAGVATTRSGAVVAFALLVDHASGDPRPALDEAAARLAACGCR